ncbi:hypothetical protein [Pontibacter sp. G13]|uniref:ArnT family glycosyltransferase n=1 Tax=Pontibacter sp. G13 TaxID=3074898 RepID=UPI00288B22E2|nr:hypothetical protein [Pontibacter sp. G13]WNJ20321.1 hypothetical protein RJD25_07560 [Pontibacter sp. G13]
MRFFRSQFPWMPILIGAFLIAHHLWAYLGPFGYDDLQYAELAHGWTLGQVDATDHFTHRLPVIGLTAISFSIFGVSDGAMALPSLGMALLMLWGVYRLLSAQGWGIRLIGLLLVAGCHWWLFYTDKLMPDLYVAIGVFGGWIAYLSSWQNSRQAIGWGMMFSLAWMWAFLSKGTILLSVPVWAVLAGWDLVRGRQRRFWVSAAVTMGVCVSLYLVGYTLWLGDPWARFAAIGANGYLNSCSYDQQPLAVLMERLLAGFWQMANRNGMLVAPVILVGGWISPSIRARMRLRPDMLWGSVIALGFFLAANFMTISPTSYVPMCLDPRHYLYLVAVAAVPAAWVLGQIYADNKLSWGWTIWMAVMTVWTCWDQQWLVGSLYFLLALLPICRLLGNRGQAGLKLAMILGLWGWLGLLWQPIQYARSIEYRQQQHEIMQALAGQPGPRSVITNDAQTRFGRFWDGFAAEAANEWVSFQYLDQVDSLHEDVVLLMNPYTWHLTGQSWEDLPPYVAYTQEPEHLLWEGAHDRKLWSATHLPLLESDWRGVARYTQGFEDSAAHWDWTPDLLTLKSPFEGQYALELAEYAGTFTLPISDLDAELGELTRIQAVLQFRSEEISSAKLVITVEEDGVIQHSESQRMEQYVRARGNWSPVPVALWVKSETLPPGGVIKIYVWNPDRIPGTIDEMEVRIATSVR